MSDVKNAVGTAALSTVLSTIAGFAGGPVLAAVVGFISGVPAPVVIGFGAVALIWFDPLFGLWLGITAITAAGAFALGTLRKPPAGLFSGGLADAEHIRNLQRRLAAERARADQAENLLRCLTVTGTHKPVITVRPEPGRTT